MKLYKQTRSWKVILFVIGSVFILSYILALYKIIGKISENERRQVIAWANTVQKKADMVNYTEDFFKELREEEHRRAEMLARAYEFLGQSDVTDMCNAFVVNDIILNNKNIPVLIADQNNRILFTNNVDFDPDTVKYFTGKVREIFSQFPPIEIPYFEDNVQYLYYTDSKLYADLYKVLDGMNRSFFDETADNIAAVPVIITDEKWAHVYAVGNIPDESLATDSIYRVRMLEKMAAQNDPIVVTLPEQGKRYVYYMDSEILTLVRIFPFVQLFIIILFVVLAYVVFSVARNSEQNQVWAGMAKETAHQLGTPISSMIAWLELLKLQEGNEEIAVELEKDIARLHVIAARFSKIGSAPSLDYQDVVPLIQETINYLKKRISSKVAITFLYPEHPVCTFTDKQLFSWVIENLTRNAVDAMEGAGALTIEVKEEGKQIVIDFTDTGKGIPKKLQQRIFSPGYTTKKRGWGLGLTLTKRILSDSQGKIFVKNSTVGVGTTFRIVMKKCD